MSENKFIKAYLKLEDLFSAFMIDMCVVVFAIMVFSVSYGVLGRYLTFVKAPRWTQELAILSLVWLCFLSAGYAIKEDKHVRMTIINLLVPKKVAAALHALAFVLLFLVSVFFVVYGIQLSMLSRSARMAATGWPMNITYYSVVIGGLYGCTTSLGRLLKGGF